MDLSIVMLAGGKAKRLGIDKALIFIKDKPLIAHTLEKVHSISDDILIITKTEKRRKKLEHVIDYPVKMFLDENPSIESPLIGALTGLKNAKHKQVLLIGCDMPLVKIEVIELLYTYYSNVRSPCLAVIPQFPNGYIEPLCAIYEKDSAVKALIQTIAEKSFRLKKFIAKISAVHFFPVAKIKELDPDLYTFFNVNTRYDLEKLIKILEDSESE
ncbi:MAG: molybdenum cofactor guanylyltransferase [Candidatus Helarchaeota archaeon]|nr:molybdenum cofactor guanylyltransferase [Candidatus Helarchaeota archaeon]